NSYATIDTIKGHGGFFIVLRVVSIIGIAGLLLLTLVIMGSGNYGALLAQSGGYSLRFYGSGNNDLHRVKIPIHPHRITDVGGDPTLGDSGDFTIEFWIKADVANNTSGTCTEGTDTWINGNMLIDRDLFGNLSYGDYGISLYGNQIAFGVHNGTSGMTICGGSNVANGDWRHIAVTRRRSDGQMQIFVDGVRVRQANGPTGNISYDDNRAISNLCNPSGTSPCNNEPFIVIGAEKHDYDLVAYPPYNGYFDELRISDSVRYSANFTRPSSPFGVDVNTVALYHFDEGRGTLIGDDSGHSNNATLRYGGFPNPGPQWSGDTPFGSGITTPTASTTPQGYRLISLPVNELLGDLRVESDDELTYWLIVPSTHVLSIYTTWEGIVAVTNVVILPQSYIVLFQPTSSTLLNGGALSQAHQQVLSERVIADLNNAFTTAISRRYANFDVQDIFISATLQQIGVGVSIVP
ncbi:MAG: hypothetical protein KJ043_16295, partial [Anaerolineae bacterium]|nr:hypothetical protein [Anaerolineae bacterium]